MADLMEVPRALIADLGRAHDVGDLLGAIEEHDHYTGSHSCRVSAFSGLLAGLLGLSDETIDTVRRAGLVHDIGKIHISRQILRKTDPLTEDEVAQIKMHPINGAVMLSSVPDMARIVPIVLHHHERWDGRGYPTGLSGIDIPLESRIIFVADAFDAMTTARTYGDIVGTRLAIEEIERCAGWQFDPIVARALRNAFDSGLLEGNGLDETPPLLMGALRSA